MPAAAIAELRFPHERILIARTKLAYVHLRNLLTDAKRDRSGRVFGYVAIWLPEGLLMLFMQEGELANATLTADGTTYEALSIAEAIARVPAEPEMGEICFHECDDEQLACMWAAQAAESLEWPPEIDLRDPKAVFSYLRAATFDGMMEVVREGAVNFLIFRDGSVVRTYLADAQVGTIPQRVLRLFEPTRSGAVPRIRRWDVPLPLPAQASPALILAYRGLVSRLVARLAASGNAGAAEMADSARAMLVEKHPVLEEFTLANGAGRDPVVTPEALTPAIAAWVAELLFATSDFGGASPEAVLAELTHERRHMFQSAGFFDLLPWTVTW